MVDVKFYVGTYENYQGLPEKDQQGLYFLTDTLQIFRGEREYAKDVKLVSVLPETGIQGVLYIDTVKFVASYWNGDTFVPINKEYATSIIDDPTHNKVPTSQAVAEYVAAKLGEIDVNDVSVSYDSGSGTMHVGNNQAVLNGVVSAPTYDSEQRKITLPVFGGDALEINLGKDLVVKSGSLSPNKQNIILILTNDDQITIPVGSLIDIYTGMATSTASVNVSDDNKISVTVKVSATENNAITLEEDGLYVSLPDAYTKEEVDQKVQTINQTIQNHIDNANVHTTSEQLAAAKQEAINTATTQSKSYSDQLNTAMDGRVKLVEAAVTWNSIA